MTGRHASVDREGQREGGGANSSLIMSQVDGIQTIAFDMHQSGRVAAGGAECPREPRSGPPSTILERHDGSIELYNDETTLPVYDIACR